MIALVLFISVVPQIRCQIQTLPQHSELSQSSGYQGSYRGSHSGAFRGNLQNYEAIPEYRPQIAVFPQTNAASSFYSTSNSPNAIQEVTMPLKIITSSKTSTPSNLSQKMAELLSKLPKNTSPFSGSTQPIEPISTVSLQSNNFPITSQLTSTQFTPLTQSFSSIQGSQASSITSSATKPSLKYPRSIIPSPLTLTDTIPLPYHDAISNIFDLPEPVLKSVGCLELTMTPYGTITETSLPNPSISLPRSPFLPVSSPVSALAPPLSPLLPPATPAVRSSNFLRKVPVPPPFI